jgi:hypothetical protein
MGMNAPSNWDMPIEDLLGYVRAFDLASGVWHFFHASWDSDMLRFRQVQRSPIRKSPVAIGLNNNVEIVIMLNQGKALCR